MRISVAVLIMMAQITIGQTNRKALLVGKWKEIARDTSLKSKVNDQFCKIKSFCRVHEFTSDQNYLLTNNGVIIPSNNGKWKFKGDSLIRIYEKGIATSKIEKLSKDELVISVWEGGFQKFKWEKPGYIYLKKIP